MSMSSDHALLLVQMGAAGSGGGLPGDSCRSGSHAQQGHVDQDVHAGNILCTLDGKAWVKADLGSAMWHEEVVAQPKSTTACKLATLKSQ